MKMYQVCFPMALPPQKPLNFTNFPKKSDVIRAVKTRRPQLAELTEKANWPCHRLGKREVAKGYITIEVLELIDNDLIGRDSLSRRADQVRM